MLFPGFRFKPTDKEIITYFLRRKVVEREPFPPPLDGFVPDCKVVGKIEPWVLWEQSGGPNSLDQGVYFFTELKVKSTNPNGGVRYCRQIESGGTWSGSTTDDVKDDEGNVIGLKRHLHYEKKGCDRNGEWLLDEYCIPESSTVVFCRLKKSPRFIPKEQVCPKQKGKRKHSNSELMINEPSMKRARTECPNLDDDHAVNDEPQTPNQSGISTIVVLDDEENADSGVNMDDIRFANELFSQLHSGEEEVQGTTDGEQPPMACEIVPTLQLQNVVSTVNLDCKLDLNAIAQKAPNAQYNPTKFAKLTLRMKEPKATALIFAAGKMVCTGAKSEKDSELAARKFVRIVQNLGFPAKFKDFQVRNIVASCDLKFPIVLAGLAESATHGPCSTYNPESFPGLTYRMKGSKIVIRVFMSGKIVVTGAKVRAETYAAFDHIYPILQQFRRKPTMYHVQGRQVQVEQPIMGKEATNDGKSATVTCC